MNNIAKIIYVLVLTNVFTPFYGQDRTHNYVYHERMLDATATTKNITVTYLDGIGRPIRNVTNSNSMNGTYTTSMQLYDECGRKGKRYFPIKNGNTPAFMTNSEFTSSSNKYYGENGAFEEKHYDVLDREVSHFKGGEEWLYNERQITKKILTNKEPIKRYALSSAGTNVIEKNSYPIGSLYVEETSDEDEVKLAIYTNGIGQKVLERRAESNDTYFIYDDLGHLRFVLSPNFQHDGDLSASAYEYKYNGKGKCIWKRLPGAQYIQYWYDKNDRLMYEQDGELRKRGIFRFYLYDGLGRLAVQGTTSSIDNTCTNANTTMTESLGFMQTGYILKKQALTKVDIELINYYDTYDYLQLPFFKDYYALFNRSTPPKLPLSLKTGTIRYSSQGSIISQSFYYNERGLIEEEYALYPNNTFMKKKYIYSFTGQPTEEKIELNQDLQNYSYKILNTYYPYNDKISKIELELPNKTRKLVAEYEYDEIGRLRKFKKGNYADCIFFEYNTRGSVTQIRSNSFRENLYYANSSLAVPCFNGNISFMTWQTANDQVFRGYTFSYDNLNRLTTSTYGEGQDLQLNKNLYSEIIQEYDANSSPLALKRYGKKNNGTYGIVDDLQFAMKGNQIMYVSDNAECLLYSGSFDFKQKSDEEYKYNANGALAYEPNKSLTIDYDNMGYPQNLNYQNGNKTSFDYTPDGEILSLTHQTSLPSTLSLTANVPYQPVLSTVTSKTEYVGNFIFEQGHISKILFKDGYYQFSDSLCHYYIKDHLGSVRAVMNEKGILEQVNHYYPFGGYFGDACYNADFQNNKYNGKELIRMHGLDWYAYGERYYNSVLNCWDRIDKLSELYYHISPYAYCGGNPILFIDKDGQKIEFAPGASKTFMANFSIAVKYLKENKMDGILAKLQKNAQTIYIAETPKGEHSHFLQNEHTIYWDPYTALQTDKGAILSPTTILNHEADHALEFISNPKQMKKNMSVKIKEYNNKEEYRVITGSEQRTAEALGEIPKSSITRTNHFGIFVTVSQPDLNIPGAPIAPF